VFKFLHVGMLSELQSKIPPAIAKLVGLKDGQSLHHFLRDGVWEVEQSELLGLEIDLVTTIGQRRIVCALMKVEMSKKGKNN